MVRAFASRQRVSGAGESQRGRRAARQAGAGFRLFGRRARAERGVQRAEAGFRRFVLHECDTLVAVRVESPSSSCPASFLCSARQYACTRFTSTEFTCMVCMMHVMLRIRRIRWVKGLHEDVVSVYLEQQRHRV